MAPPTAPLHLDVEAISGICGSISIACWVVVFSPQIVENFRRGSADALSLQFIVVWLLGDVFNILGAVLQGVLPTMIILAVYYTIADVVLLAQCFYYRGFTLSDEPAQKPAAAPTSKGSAAAAAAAVTASERTALLAADGDLEWYGQEQRRGADWSQSHHLSPAMPLPIGPDPALLPPRPPPTKLQAAAFNALAVFMVCAAGVAGWWLSQQHAAGSLPDDNNSGSGDDEAVLHFDLWGQIFGWLCAVLYLGSRLPQLLLNFRRKSTEGVSMLFFLFACLGNLTYVLSIIAYQPHCRGAGGEACDEEDGCCEPGEAAAIYGRYILVNLSWLAGSLGTLALDMGIFVQFFMYSRDEDEDGDGDDEYDDGAVDDDDGEAMDSERWEPRPLLQRSSSNYA